MNKIAKKCYEKKFGTQKYKDSVLYGTFDDVMEDIVQEAKKEVFNDIEPKLRTLLGEGFEELVWYKEMKKRHLSTFADGKSNIIADKQNPPKISKDIEKD